MVRPNWQLLLVALAVVSSSQGCITSNPADYGDSARAKALSLPSCPQGLLDDGEDNNAQIIKQGGRDGYWFTFTDQFGTTVEPKGAFAMTPGGPAGSRYAARIRGKVVAQPPGQYPYVGVGFGLTNPKTPFDLSAAKGISFWAKGPGRVRFKAPDANTIPEGDRCSDCYNDFGLDLYLTDQWVRYTVPFDKLAQQPGWGDRAPEVSTKEIFAVQWQYSTFDTEYEFWFDNIELVGCE